MTHQLRDELARIAERSPAIHTPADAWSRGRRARQRDRIVAGAAVFALVLVLGGIAALVGDPSTRIAPASPPDGEGAVPSTIYSVPGHVQDSEALTSDLAIGQGALAFVTDDRDLPVVVSARDGSYAVLDLPGWPWSDPDPAPTLNSSTMQPGAPPTPSPPGTATWRPRMV